MVRLNDNENDTEDVTTRGRVTVLCDDDMESENEKLVELLLSNSEGETVLEDRVGCSEADVEGDHDELTDGPKGVSEIDGVGAAAVRTMFCTKKQNNKRVNSDLLLGFIESIECEVKFLALVDCWKGMKTDKKIYFEKKKSVNIKLETADVVGNEKNQMLLFFE